VDLTELWFDDVGLIDFNKAMRLRAKGKPVKIIPEDSRVNYI